MGLVTILDAALDVRVHVVGLTDVALEAGAELAQVVPETRETSPIFSVVTSKAAGKLGHLVQMLVQHVRRRHARSRVNANMGPHRIGHQASVERLVGRYCQLSDSWR